MKEKKRTNLAQQNNLSADDKSKTNIPQQGGTQNPEIARLLISRIVSHDPEKICKTNASQIQVSASSTNKNLRKHAAASRNPAGSTAASMKAPPMYKPANFDRTPGGNKTPRHHECESVGGVSTHLSNVSKWFYLCLYT